MTSCCPPRSPRRPPEIASSSCRPQERHRQKTAPRCCSGSGLLPATAGCSPGAPALPSSGGGSGAAPGPAAAEPSCAGAAPASAGARPERTPSSVLHTPHVGQRPQETKRKQTQGPRRGPGLAPVTDTPLPPGRGTHSGSVASIPCTCREGALHPVRGLGSQGPELAVSQLGEGCGQPRAVGPGGSPRVSTARGQLRGPQRGASDLRPGWVGPPRGQGPQARSGALGPLPTRLRGLLHTWHRPRGRSPGPKAAPRPAPSCERPGAAGAGPGCSRHRPRGSPGGSTRGTRPQPLQAPRSQACGGTGGLGGGCPPRPRAAPAQVRVRVPAAPGTGGTPQPAVAQPGGPRGSPTPPGPPAPRPRAPLQRPRSQGTPQPHPPAAVPGPRGSRSRGAAVPRPPAAVPEPSR